MIELKTGLAFGGIIFIKKKSAEGKSNIYSGHLIVILV